MGPGLRAVCKRPTRCSGGVSVYSAGCMKVGREVNRGSPPPMSMSLSNNHVNMVGAPAERNKVPPNQ